MKDFFRDLGTSFCELKKGSSNRGSFERINRKNDTCISSKKDLKD